MNRINYQINNGYATFWKDGSYGKRLWNINELKKEFIKPYGFIYKITNIENEKVYIGQTIKLPLDRFKEHTKCSFHGTKTILYNALKKYGEESKMRRQR